MYNALASVVGNPVSLKCETNKDCAGNPCILGICYDTETHWHNALSLAFNLEDGIPVPNWNNWQTESTWTESKWEYPSIQLFAMDNPVVEIVTFVCGLLEVGASFLLVWLLKKYFERKF